MIQMTHYNDGKGKFQSHEISFILSGDDSWMSFGDCHICDLSIGEVTAYGETQEEAIQNLKPVMEWLFKEYRAIEKLYNSGFYEKDIVEVDCFGKVIT